MSEADKTEEEKQDSEIIDCSPPGETSVKSSPFQEAERLFEEGQLEKSRVILNKLWLENTYDERVIALYGEILKEGGRPEAGKRLGELVEKLKSPMPPYKHHQEIFEAGYALVDVRQHDLASLLLGELVKELPHDPLVNYELGFALMCQKKFDDAARHFEKAMEEKEDFDCLLNLCVCHTLRRDASKAGVLLGKLAAVALSDEEKIEVEHRRIVLRRLANMSSKRTLNARDWLYILYGSVLLRPNLTITNGKADIKQLASTMVVLKGFLEGLSIEEETIEYYSLRSKPMTQILGSMLELKVDAYRGPDRPEKCLLMMCWSTDILGPHDAFITNSERRALFAFAITDIEPLPVMPDIVACMSTELTMPWEGKENTKRELDEQIELILEKASDLEGEPELIRETQEAIDYYMDKRDLLVFNNPHGFASRPEYTAELGETGEQNGNSK